MSKQIHKIGIPFFRSLISITSMGIVVFSIVLAGCAEQGAGPKQEISPEAVTKRIEPVGAVNVTPAPEEATEAAAIITSTKEKPPQEPAPTSGGGTQEKNLNEASPAADGEKAPLAYGKTIVEKSCATCHAGHLPGAPVIGNPADWSPRLAQGEETLVQHAINGYKAMPPKGGNPNLSNEDIAAAVAYIIAQVNK